jgi:N-acetylglucosamine-6-phosphate deacetylase
MDRGMTNLLRWLDLPEEQVWTMSTANPARLLGLPNKGTLRVGADADLVLWDSSDDRLEAAQTWFNGRCVYRAE